MGLFGNLFKKKPGGTLVGNLIRTVANTATGGILGNGANMIPVSQAPAGTVLAPSPTTIANAPIMQPVLSSGPVQSVANATQGVIDSLGNAASQVGESALKSTLKKYWWVIALPCGLLILAFITLFKRTGKRR